ncbi:MAG: DUF1571 domain-containing protein [Nitrospirota bacterium]
MLILNITMTYRTIFIAFFLCMVMSAPALAEDPAKIINGMSAAYSKVDDYTAIFYKREGVNGKVLPQEKILMKFKKPFKIYMKWLPPGPHAGREVLYVKGENDGKVIGHEGGLISFFTLHMKPTGSIAMKGNSHPITDMGIGRLIEIVENNFKRGEERKELKLKFLGSAEVYGRKAWHIIGELPPFKGYYASRIEIWVDKRLNLPIKIRIFGPGGELLESYGYSDLKINPGLKDEEFTEGYKGYHF